MCSKARNALNQSVFAVRQALGEAAIVSEGSSLRLDEQMLPSDIGLLFDAAAEGRNDHVLSLAAGEFLDGVHVASGEQFERWADEQRAMVRQAILTSLRRIADRASREGHPERLVSALRRRLALTPLETDVVVEFDGGVGRAWRRVCAAFCHRGGSRDGGGAGNSRLVPAARIIALERSDLR